MLVLVFWALNDGPMRGHWIAARSHGIAGLLVLSAAMIFLRQVGWLDREPFGFWPRWIYVWGLLAWALALLRVAPRAPAGLPRAAVITSLVLIWLVLDFTGRGIFWYQRPIHRLREVVPDRIYISAMPTRWGLELAQERHHFRTIINLFPEYTPERSPLWPDELRFVREHGLNYVGNDPDDDPTGGEFIARTLAVANDPAAWPILVHCHASMDRSPAWMGLYRFVIQGWPLADALREIERHRGLRPKASVTLLYNRVLPRLAPERAATDPTVPLLRRMPRGPSTRSSESRSGPIPQPRGNVPKSRRCHRSSARPRNKPCTSDSRMRSRTASRTEPKVSGTRRTLYRPVIGPPPMGRGPRHRSVLAMSSICQLAGLKVLQRLAVLALPSGQPIRWSSVHDGCRRTGASELRIAGELKMVFLFDQCSVFNQSLP